MRHSQPAKRGESSAPPFYFAAAATVLLVLVAGTAFAAGTATDRHKSPGQPASILLTVDQAIDMALRANRNIARSRYGAESRRYSIDSAQAPFDLKLVPAGGVSLSGRNDTNDTDITAGLQFRKKLETGTTVSLGPLITRSSAQSSQQYSTDMGVTVTQPFLRGMGREVNTDGVQSADAAYKASLRNIHQTKVNTVLETVSAYYDAVLQMEMLLLYEKLRERLKGHSEVARAKEKVGLTTPMDTYRAEIPLMETEDALIAASEAFQNARDRLKIILALPQDTELAVTTPEAPIVVESSLDEAVNIALENTVEIEQLNQDMAEAKRKTAIAKHNILPDITLVAGYGRYSEANSMGQSTRLDIDRYSLSLLAGTDLFRTAERAAYEQTLINMKVLGMDIESRKEEISRQVRKQWLSLKEAGRRMEIRKSQIKQGEEKIALAEVKFAHRMADNFDVIEAEKELQSARSNLLAARIDYAIGSYNLKAIMGSLIPRSE